MPNNAVREQIAQDVGQWLADGLVSKPTHDLLRERYSAREFGIGRAIKSLGIAGGLIAFLGLLGLAASISRSKVVGAMMMMCVGGGLIAGGIHLASDRLGRYAISSKAVLALGVISGTVGVGVMLDASGLQTSQVIAVTGPLVLIPVGFLAYRFRNTFLLVLGLLEFFHWVGSWNQMMGRSTYELDIQDPRVMSIAALAAVIVGIYHERELRFDTGRFFLAYEATGLVYLNLSLLILTIDNWHANVDTVTWIGAWFLAALAQIVAGARLHNSLLTGFGVTAFAVNVYTRYYEDYWNRMHSGTFFLVGGAALLIAGAVCELVLRQGQRRAS